jgi:hypothetical protein
MVYKRSFSKPGLRFLDNSRRIKKIGSWTIETFIHIRDDNPQFCLYDNQGYVNFPFMDEKTKKIRYDEFNIPPAGVRDYMDKHGFEILKQAREYYEQKNNERLQEQNNSDFTPE